MSFRKHQWIAVKSSGIVGVIDGWTKDNKIRCKFGSDGPYREFRAVDLRAATKEEQAEREGQRSDR